MIVVFVLALLDCVVALVSFIHHHHYNQSVKKGISKTVEQINAGFGGMVPICNMSTQSFSFPLVLEPMVVWCTRVVCP